MRAIFPMIACALSAQCGCGAASAKHNILYIMADDLNADWKNDRLAWMPNLKRFFSEEGTQFENHVAAQPVCGPSRSSMLLGRYPHNTGYVNNADEPSYANFLKQANNTVGRWLMDAGYYTAFFGKYVNGMEGHVPSGWSYWGALVNTYDFYNATVWMKDWEDPDFGPPQKRLMTHIHQADFLGNFTVEHAAKAVAASRPFFISVTPVMPHWGTCYGPGPTSVYPAYDPHWEFDLGSPHAPTTKISCGTTCAMPISPCPTDRNRHRFDGQTNPRIKDVWNVSIKGNRPQFMRKLEQASGHLTEFQAWREDIGWQNRSASLIDLDEMIGGIVEGITKLGVLNNTVMFFTSDNGYHLGEHKMPFGKGEPYDTDVRLPMYVRGPGVLPGRVLPHPTNHLDITATIVELAGAVATPNPAGPLTDPALDGLSFLSDLAHNAPPTRLADSWRQHSFSEFFANDNTWRLVRVVNSTHKFSFIWWCTNDTEIFDMKGDKWQTLNVDGEEGNAFAVRAADDAGRMIAPLGVCKGQACSKPVPAANTPTGGSLTCYQAKGPGWQYLGSFNLITDKETSRVIGIRGWAVDLSSSLPGKQPGTEPVIVRLRVNGKFGLIKPIVADMRRTDLPTANPNVPDPYHGWQYNATDLPASLMQGQKRIALLGHVGENGQYHPYGGKKGAGDVRCLCDGIECPC